MPPMPGSISRGLFMRALQTIANTQTVDGLRDLRERLTSGEQHVDLFAPLAQNMSAADISHLARHWYRENPANPAETPATDERWWGPQTDLIVRFGLIRSIDLILEARGQGKTTYVDCFWICRGAKVEIANTRAEHEGTVYINVLVMTPPIPSKQNLVDAGAPYDASDEIWVTTNEESTRYGGTLMPGLAATPSSPPSERAQGIETVELRTISQSDPRYVVSPAPPAATVP